MGSNIQHLDPTKYLLDGTVVLTKISYRKNQDPFVKEEP